MSHLPPDQAKAVAVGKADWGKPVARVWVTIPSLGNTGRSPRKEGNRYTFEGEKATEDIVYLFWRQWPWNSKCM